jgi:hypothetical protein
MIALLGALFVLTEFAHFGDSLSTLLALAGAGALYLTLWCVLALSGHESSQSWIRGVFSGALAGGPSGAVWWLIADTAAPIGLALTCGVVLGALAAAADL